MAITKNNFHLQSLCYHCATFDTEHSEADFSPFCTLLQFLFLPDALSTFIEFRCSGTAHHHTSLLTIWQPQGNCQSRQKKVVGCNNHLLAGNQSFSSGVCVAFCAWL